jgi:hypothetical protein
MVACEPSPSRPELERIHEPACLLKCPCRLPADRRGGARCQSRCGR